MSAPEKGGFLMEELTVEATFGSIAVVTEFVDHLLEQYGCPVKAQTQIDIAIDELFSNIVRYAYFPGVGPATVRVEVLEKPLSVIITFIDQGVPYDPLSKDNPDVTLSAEERELGGLGIYIVKKNMNEITYEYKEGKNILRIRKDLFAQGQEENGDTKAE